MVHGYIRSTKRALELIPALSPSSPENLILYLPLTRSPNQRVLLLLLLLFQPLSPSPPSSIEELHFSLAIVKAELFRSKPAKSP
ncbi:hypothetical protein SprV_0501829400 [Sparganum proliferum]